MLLGARRLSRNMKSQIIAIFFAESISCTQKRGQNGERAPEFSFHPSKMSFDDHVYKE